MIDEAQNTAPIEAIEAETPKPNFDEFIRGIAPVIKVAPLEREADIPKNAIHYTLPHKSRKQMPIPNKHYGAILKALCLRFEYLYIPLLGFIYYSKDLNEFWVMHPFTTVTFDEIKNYFQ